MPSLTRSLENPLWVVGEHRRKGWTREIPHPMDRLVYIIYICLSYPNPSRVSLLGRSPLRTEAVRCRLQLLGLNTNLIGPWAKHGRSRGRERCRDGEGETCSRDEGGHEELVRDM